MVAVIDRSTEVGAPRGGSGLTVCVNQDLGDYAIYYLNASPQQRLHSLWHESGIPQKKDLSRFPSIPDEQPAKGLLGYVDTTRNIDIILLPGVDSIFWRRPNMASSAAGFDKLNEVANAPSGLHPVGYYDRANDMHHVIYVSNVSISGVSAIHELFWKDEEAVQHGGNLTALASAPGTSGSFVSSAYINGQGNVVFYMDKDSHVRSVFWGTDEVGTDDLSGVAQTPDTKTSPRAYYMPHNDMNQVFYVSKDDGHLYELFWAGNDPVRGWNVTEASGSPPLSAGVIAFYSKGRNEKHVIYVTGDRQIHDISWIPGGTTPVDTNISEKFTLPKLRGHLNAFALEKRNELHLVYFGEGAEIGGRVMEVIW